LRKLEHYPACFFWLSDRQFGIIRADQLSVGLAIPHHVGVSQYNGQSIERLTFLQ
jgi:hypothetical protein